MLMPLKHRERRPAPSLLRHTQSGFLGLTLLIMPFSAPEQSIRHLKHSPKYFGLKPGISVLTLIAGHLPLRSKIISANDHESHHLYDVLFNQSTEVIPEVVSTDQHGINAFNFAILNSFGYQFAPRYAKFKNVFEKYFKIQSTSKYRNGLQLKKSINWNLITDEWDNIIHILISLEQRNSTQAFLMKKMCSFKKCNRTLKALHEYDTVFKLLHLLDYADDEILRQQVQGTLNIGESFHQMNRAITGANGSSKFKGRNETDFAILNESTKLIANCILYYNAYILSELLAHFEQLNNENGLALVKQTSPVAWAHINLSGYFQFASNEAPYQIEQVIESLKRAA